MEKLDMIADVINRHAPTDGIFECMIPGVKLVRWSKPTSPMAVVYQPTVCVVAQGRKQAILGDRTFNYDKAQFLLASVDLPVMGSVLEASEEKPYLCLQIDLDTVEIAELAIRYPADKTDVNLPTAGLTLNRVTPDLLDAVLRLLTLQDTPADVDAIAPLAMREILYRLIRGPSGDTLRQILQAGTRLNQIARATVWIKHHFRRKCPVEEAAEVAGMSRSTFHAHFKAVTMMSPLEFRTNLRLQEARRLMMSDGLDAATAGFNVGYASPSQFSRDYTRVFGMPPAKHVARLRQTGETYPDLQLPNKTPHDTSTVRDRQAVADA